MAEIRTRLTADTSQFERSMRKATKTARTSSTRMSSSFSNIGSGLANIGGLAMRAVPAIAAIGGGLALLNGRNLDQVRYAFEKLSASVGANTEEFMAQLQEASLGMVTNFKLMEEASRGMVLGLKQTELVEFLKIATASAKATGQTVTEAFGDIVLGTARMSMEILDNLGIQVRANDAYAEYAKILNISASELTGIQKRQAFTNAVMKAGQKQVEVLGASTKGTLSETAKLMTTMSNLWDTMTTKSKGYFETVAGGLNSLMSKWKSSISGIGGTLFTKFDPTVAKPKMTKVAHGGKLNGNGVAAKQAQAKAAITQDNRIAEIRAANLESLNKVLDSVRDKGHKTEEERLQSWYKKKLSLYEGDTDALVKLEEIKNEKMFQLASYKQEQALELFDEEQEMNLSANEAELARIEEWYQNILDLTGSGDSLRLEAYQLYIDRKAEMHAEALENEISLENSASTNTINISKQTAEFEVDIQKSKYGVVKQMGELALRTGTDIGKKAFLATQAFAAAEAIVNTHAAVMKTMATVPYPLNIPLAAAQAAIGAAHVASIVSTSVGSKSMGGGGGGGGSAPTTPSSSLSNIQPQQLTQEDKKGELVINIMGDIMNEDYVDLLAERISEAVQDRNVTLKASQARIIQN